MSGKYGKGAKKDHPSKRTQKSSRELLGEPEATPPSGTLERFEAKTLDQGQSGSCVGHGTAQGVAISCASTGVALGFVPSPRTNYAVVRTLEKSAPTDALTDSGAMPADMMTALSGFGCRPIRPPTPDGRNSDIWTAADTTAEPPNVNVDEDLGDLLTAGQKVLTGEYRIDETAADFLTQIEAAITAGYAVGIGIFVDSAFENWSPSAQPQGLTTTNFSDPNGGGHWLCMDAYQTSQDGSKTYSGPNSWSDTYGAGALVDTVNCPNPGGHYRVTDSWMREQAAQGADIYVFKVSLV